jgi:hypothetical protein
MTCKTRPALTALLIVSFLMQNLALSNYGIAQAEPFDQSQQLSRGNSDPISSEQSDDELVPGLQELAKYAAELNANSPAIGDDEDSVRALKTAAAMTPEEAEKAKAPVRIGLYGGPHCLDKI